MAKKPTTKADVTRTLKQTILQALGRRMSDFDWDTETDYDEMSVKITITSDRGKPIGAAEKSTEAKAETAKA